MNIEDILDLVEEFVGFPQEELTAYLKQVETSHLPIPDAEFLNARPDCAPAQTPETQIVCEQRHITQRVKVKWYRPCAKLSRTGRHRRTKKKGICFHHTAVRGGFSLHKSELSRIAKVGRGGSDECILNSRDFTDEVYASLCALGARYRGAGPINRYNTGVPYHAITGSNACLYLNLPFDWVTWHGNAANNDYLGYAWDGKSGHDTLDVADVTEDVIMVCKTMITEGHSLLKFVAHSNYTNKPSDPGVEFLEEIILPVAQEVGANVDLTWVGSRKGTSFNSQIKKAARIHTSPFPTK